MGFRKDAYEVNGIRVGHHGDMKTDERITRKRRGAETMTEEKLNPFSIAQQELDEAAETLGLEPAVHELLRRPMYEIQALLPVRMDDGSTRVFRGFRVQN